MTQSKGGSSLGLAAVWALPKHGQKTAAQAHAVMHAREAEKCLNSRVEMDDAYIDGKRKGKSGRGSAGKSPFVAAVENTDDGKPQRTMSDRFLKLAENYT